MQHTRSRCTYCGGQHRRSKCPWPMPSAQAAADLARGVGRFLLALLALAILMGVCGSMDLQDAQVLAGSVA